MKSRIAISLCALPALLASTMQAQNRAQSAAAIPVAITNVTVIDVETGRRHLDQTVLVSGRRISAVRPSACTRVPNPARAIHGRGKFLRPGLRDMPVHSAAAAERELPVYVALGITGVRNMHTTADTALQLVAAIRRQVESGDLPGPRFIANGPIVDGPRPIHRGSVPVASPETARRVVDSLADGGADFIKVYNLLPRDAYFALAERAKQRGIPFVGHVPQDVRVEEASEAGQRSIEHLNGLPEACSSVGDSVRGARASGADYAPVDRVRAIALLAATSSPARCASAI